MRGDTWGIDLIPPYFPVLTPADTRRTEQKAFDLGVPSILLMERAAMAVTDALKNALGGDCRGKRALFLCGAGNNGGDGLAAARLFAMQGGRPTVWLYGPPKTPDAKTSLRWLRQIPAADILDLSALQDEALPFCGDGPFDGYVDALLGTGFRGEPDGLLARMMDIPRHDVHPNGAPVIAVDIPSGIDGKTGAAPGAFVRADVTVTFNTPKPGLYLTREREAVGKIVVADIGLWPMMPWNSGTLLPDDLELDCKILNPSALRLMGKRPLRSHKGDCGRVLIYAGKMGMAGAAAMCAKAAVAAGAGLTTIACEREIMPILQTLVPNAMCVDIGEAVKNPPACDVFSVGCGLGQSEGVWDNILRLWDPEKKSVWDADALNLLAKHEMKLGKNAVMTPHPGEAARLLGWPMARVLEDRMEAARTLSEKFDCTALLKSDVTVICSPAGEKPAYYLNAVGSPALAKGGSGDALAGNLAARMHENPVLPEACAQGCLWHGMAGLVGEEKFGQRELTTDQLISCLHEAEQWGRGERSAPAGWRG